MFKCLCGHVFLSLLSMYLAVNLLGHLEIDVEPLEQGCQTHLHWGPHQPHGFLQRAEIMLGLYNCNYSLTVEELQLYSALWRQLRGWCGPQCKWVWHPCSKGSTSISRWPNKFTAKYILKRDKNICPQKNLDMSVHSSIIYNSPKVETM